MKEQDFINTIVNLTQSQYIGDDCAYLKDLNIAITQDNFIEDVHFKTKWATAWQIGYKAAAVNISDILASGSRPLYLSVGVSLPSSINNSFIEDLYKGIISGAYGAKIIGGDITAGDKIFISITAIGSTIGRNISSRKNAKPGYKVITRGNFGLSTKGLTELTTGGQDVVAIKAHLEPNLDTEFSDYIAFNIKDKYAMMDTSDGLADALFKIAQASNVTICANDIDGMFCAEDYKLVAAVPSNFMPDLYGCKVIAEVCKYNGAFLKVGNKIFNNYDELGTYNHFGE